MFRHAMKNLVELVVSLTKVGATYFCHITLIMFICRESV
jgi:hypothetical protein